MTSFDEAFDLVLSLPKSKRMLVGRGSNLEAMDWAAGSIDDVALLACNRDPELEQELSQRVAEFKVSGSRTATMISSDSGGAVTVLVLGADSAESVSELARGCAERFADDYVAEYLAGKQDEWKRPLADVLPFRRRTGQGIQ